MLMLSTHNKCLVGRKVGMGVGGGEGAQWAVDFNQGSRKDGDLPS